MGAWLFFGVRIFFSSAARNFFYSFYTERHICFFKFNIILLFLLLKILVQIIFLYPSQPNYFFPQNSGSNYVFNKNNHAPLFRLNGLSVPKCRHVSFSTKIYLSLSSRSCSLSIAVSINKPNSVVVRVPCPCLSDCLTSEKNVPPLMELKARTL